MITQDHLKWCDSDVQTNVIAAILVSDGNMRKAARELGYHHSKVQRIAARVEMKAARGGFAPGHFEKGVAPGYTMGKVTVHRDKNGQILNTWERQSPNAEAQEAAMRAAFEELSKELPRQFPIPFAQPDPDAGADLLNLFTITDYHLGMLAWEKETGADWDLEIAEDLLYRAFEKLIVGAPAAKVAIINQLGDFLHTDGLKALTPEHGHLLDADSRFQKIVAVAVRVLRRLINLALETHEHVHVILAEGNHDMVSSIWLRTMFAALYEDEPRVTIDDTPVPYYVYVWGETLIGAHHGHLAKGSSLPGLFAAKFRKEWGRTTRAYIHVGHRHHQETKEYPGALIVQHSTLAAPDAYAARGGWMNDRQMKRYTYHTSFGEVGQEVVTPDMVA